MSSAADGRSGSPVTVPVPLVGGRADDFARADADDCLATGLDESFALGDVEGLSEAVGVPGGARAGREVHCADGQARRRLPWAIESIQTSPVNHSPGPLADGFLGWT